MLFDNSQPYLTIINTFLFWKKENYAMTKILTHLILSNEFSNCSTFSDIVFKNQLMKHNWVWWNRHNFKMKNKVTIQAFCRFCNETSLPGLPYLNREMSKPWKLLWVLFLIAIYISSSYVFVFYFLQHLNARTVTTIDSAMASLDDITFPSIFLCNTNQVIYWIQVVCFRGKAWN